MLRIGTSGWDYAHWAGTFYPPGVRGLRRLQYLSERLDSVELNGTFYSLQRPASYLRWAAATPAGFCFAVKGHRWITHMKKLVDPVVPLGNFFGSGVLALAGRLGPVLRWEPWLEVTADQPLRHALEVRHDSFRNNEKFLGLLARHDVALVVADTAGRFPLIMADPASFVYVRLHGSQALYASDYGREELATWAGRIRTWHASGKDVDVYFDNDTHGYAPANAVELRRMLADG